MPHHKPGKVVVLFGNFPLTIRLPAAPKDEQLDFLRDRIIFHTNNLVEYGLWDEPISDTELEEIMSDVEIEPIFFPGFDSVLSWLGDPLSILKKN
ncbi:hypothetical protein I8752_14340 [Nostocaceae cyanobacterium CENA369]|jgi:hypothetical protein|uniref:Uncharacterized protein n=1 Tax=Dendronalium phyllosphericum CENA369 TaxID=1725256 RepID=A0A8J7LFT7_9NOST|nr:hypothetical protein [Dendronalium phyllosphericum]MBH8574174.1 hypothetical protein [Dendronalium phyllosphericum CENA369]